MVDRGGEPAEFTAVALEFDAAAQRAADGDALYLAAEFLEGQSLASLEQVQCQQQQGQQAERHAQQSQNRHEIGTIPWYGTPVLCRGRRLVAQ